MFTNFKNQYLDFYNNLITQLKNIFSKKNLIFSGIFIIVGLIIHAELIVRESLNSDSFTTGYLSNAGKWEVSLGRWFLVILSRLRFGLNTPVFSTFFSIVITCISVIFIIDLFNIQKNTSKILLALFLLSIPPFMETLTFCYCSIDYSFCMLLSVLVPWFLFKVENKFFSITLSSIALTLSMGIYQSYLGVSIGLFLINIIFKLFISAKNEYTIKNILKDFCALLISTLIGFTLYAIISQISLTLFNVETASYRGANNISITQSIIAFPKSFCKAYKSFWITLFGTAKTNNSFYYREPLHIIIFISTVLLIFIENIKYKKYKELLLQLLLLISLPLAFNLMGFIATEAYWGILMSSGIYMIFVLSLTLLDNSKFKLINCVLILTLLFLIFTYIFSINASYVAWDLTRQQTLSVAEEILEKIEELSKDKENPKICIVGSITSKSFSKNNSIYKATSKHNSESGIFWANSSYKFLNRTWVALYNKYFAHNINLCSYEDYLKILSTEDFKRMDIFINSPSVKSINGIITVKLTNNPVY